jgi:hypothetical protein
MSPRDSWRRSWLNQFKDGERVTDDEEPTIDEKVAA